MPSRVPCRRVRSRSAGVPAGLGQQQVDVVAHRGLGEHQGDVTGLQRGPHRAGVVELGNADPAGDALGQAALQRGHLLPVQVHQALLEVAVVVPLEQHDRLAAGGGSRQPDGLGVGLGGGQGELPLPDRVAAGEFLGHHHRLLGGQQELGGPRCPRLDRGHDDRVRVPAEHRHVGGVEVEVAEPVDVGEPGALAVVDVDQLVVVEGHPGHRHAVGHVLACAGEHGPRPGPGLLEAGHLPGVQFPDPGLVKIPVCGHSTMLDPAPPRRRNALRADL